MATDKRPTKRALTTLPRSASLTLLDLQNRALQLALEERPLHEALDELMHAVESQSSNGVLGSTLLATDNGKQLRHGAGPSLPAAYNAAIDGINTGVGIGSCGTAAATNRPVYVADIATDPLWKDFKELAMSHGLRACWSTPFTNIDGKVLGTFAMYYREPRQPQPVDLEIVDLITRSAALIVERHRATRKLAESEERLRLATEAAEVGFWDVDVIHDILIWPPRVKAMFGISADVPVSMLDFYQGVHPEDRDATTAAYLAAADPQVRALYDVDYRTIGREDRLTRWIAAKGRGVFNAQGQCIRVIGTAIDITRRKADEEKLRRLNESLEIEIVARIAERDRLWKNTQDMQVVIDSKGVFQAVNPAASDILGWTSEDMIGRTVFDFIHPEDISATTGALTHATSADLPIFENRYRHKDGAYRVISWVAAPEKDLIYASGRNVTVERRRDEELAEAQERLRQSQKMEAVGQLTGGIAHDFNNLLVGITGSLELLQRRVAAGRLDGLERYASTAITSAQRAAALTQRLLAFARRQPLDPKRVDANRLVAEMEDLLRRTLGPSIDLEMVMSGGLWPTLCDPNQLESAILNLAINSRDAMPEGGRLTIETSNVHLDDAYARAQGGEVKAGQYVAIAVTDTGVGMPPDIIDKAFDPFFTTKPLGQGTGLGLSMLYGCE